MAKGAVTALVYKQTVSITTSVGDVRGSASLPWVIGGPVPRGARPERYPT